MLKYELYIENYRKKIVPEIMKIGKKIPLSKRKVLSSRESVFKIFLAASVLMSIWFMFGYFLDPNLLVYGKQILITWILVLILLIISPSRPQYPIIINDDYRENVIKKIFGLLADGWIISDNDGFLQSDMVKTMNPLLKNIERLASMKGAGRPYYSNEFMLKKDNIEISLVNFGLSAVKSSFAYKGFVFKMKLKKKYPGKHYFYNKTFLNAIGKNDFQPTENQTVLPSDSGLPEQWLLSSTSESAFAEFCTEKVYSVFSEWENNKFPVGLYCCLKNDNFVMWYDYNCSGFDPILIDNDNEILQNRILFKIIEIADIFQKIG